MGHKELAKIFKENLEGKKLNSLVISYKSVKNRTHSLKGTDERFFSLGIARFLLRKMNTSSIKVHKKLKKKKPRINSIRHKEESKKMAIQREKNEKLEILKLSSQFNKLSKKKLPFINHMKKCSYSRDWYNTLEKKDHAIIDKIKKGSKGVDIIRCYGSLIVVFNKSKKNTFKSFKKQDAHISNHRKLNKGFIFRKRPKRRKQPFHFDSTKNSILQLKYKYKKSIKQHKSQDHKHFEYNRL